MKIKKHYAKVERQKISIESRIDYIRSLFHVKDKTRLFFKELIPPESNRYEVVLTFVSMLEMIRQKSILVRQNVNFGEILLSLNEKKRDEQEEKTGERGAVS